MLKIYKATRSLRALLIAALLVAPLAFGQEGEGGYDAPYFQADFTQDLNSWTSTLVNPALTHRVDQMHASMAFYRWGLDRGNMGYQDFTLLYPIRLRHTAGLSILHARNTMEYVSVNPSDGELIFDGNVTYQDLWLIGNYGVRLLPWLALGGNAKLRSQAQFGANAFSRVPGLDVGVYMTPFSHYHWGELGVSLMAQDILPTQTPWAFQKDLANSNDLITVSRGRAGLRYSGLNHNLVVSAEMLVDNAFRDIFAALPWNEFMDALRDPSNMDVPNLDVKELFPIAFRWGFHAKYQFIPQIWFKGGWTNNNIPYLGFSYNLLYPMPEMVNFFTVDYHFGYSFIDNSANMNDERGLVMMLRASADFGRTREQKESRRMYNKLVVAPMDAYQEAMRLYTAGRYWEASFAFGKLISLYPTFFLNDRAIYYMGDSYKQLYMNQTAREIFMEALEEYTTSDMRAHYLYGIMSLDYREDNYDEAMRNHAFITNLYAESEIVGEAEYLAGEIEFWRGDLDRAKEHLERVKPTDPSYFYALYTLAIVNYETEREQAAILNLRAILNDTSTTAQKVKLQHAAAVKLGHIHFEAGDRFREAAETYSLVPENAKPHGDEALLGLAWTWAKVNQPQQTLRNADRIIALHPESPFIPEAHLIRGYALMLLRRYHDAVTAFERSLAAAGGQFVTDDDVKKRKVQFDRETEEFTPTADRIKRNAMRRPTPRSIEERAELHTGYETFAGQSREFFEYKVLAKSHTNFFMRKSDIIEDANYALARATSFARRAPAPAAPRDGQNLEDELERLRRELEALE